MNTAPPGQSDCSTFWVGGSRHDGGDPSSQWPILSLAQAIVHQNPMANSDDLPGTLFNLWNAERQPGAGIVRYIGIDELGRTLCVGFMSWARIGKEKLGEIKRDDVRVIPEHWYRPDGPVAFCTEALAFQPSVMTQAIRYVSELEGVQMLCGWRKGRFRVQKRRR